MAEQEASGAPRTLPSGERSLVDINSAIHVVPDTQAIRLLYLRLRPGGTTAEARRVAALADTLGIIRELAREMAEVLPGITRDIANAAAALERDASDVRAAALLASALNRHGTLVIDLVTFLAERGVDTDPALSTAQANYEALAELAKREAEAIGARFASAAEAVRTRGAARGAEVRVSAVRAGARPASQLHVSGYDHRPAGDPRPVNKLAFELTPQEAADVRRGHEFATEFVAFSRQIGMIADDSEADVSTIIGLVRAEIDSIAAVLDSMPDPPRLEALAQELAGTPETQEVAREARALATLARTLSDLRSTHADILTELRRNPSPNVAFEVLASRYQAIETAESQLASLTRIGEFPVRLRALQRAASSALQGDLGSRRAAVESLVDQQVPRWTRQAAALGSISQKYTDALSQLGKLRTIIGAVRGARRFATADLPLEQIEANLITVPGAAAGPGVLLLGRNVDEGDDVRVTIQIVDPQDGRAVVAEDRNIGVRTFGLHRRVTGGLAFTAEEGESFAPGISTSFIIHYQPRPGGTSPLDPSAFGVGITSVVITRDGDIQLGLGPTVALLGDILQAGFGWNLQTKGTYFMLGTPLLNLMDRLGGAAGL